MTGSEVELACEQGFEHGHGALVARGYEVADGGFAVLEAAGGQGIDEHGELGVGGLGVGGEGRKHSPEHGDDGSEVSESVHAAPIQS